MTSAQLDARLALELSGDFGLKALQMTHDLLCLLCFASVHVYAGQLVPAMRTHGL